MAIESIKLKRVQPKFGDKLYRVSWDTHEIEIVTFIREEVQPGATLPTWLLRRKDGQKFLTSVGAYEVSAFLAWQDHARQLERGIKDQEQAIKDASKRLKEGKEQALRARQMMRRVST